AVAVLLERGPVGALALGVGAPARLGGQRSVRRQDLALVAFELFSRHEHVARIVAPVHRAPGAQTSRGAWPPTASGRAPPAEPGARSGGCRLGSDGALAPTLDPHHLRRPRAPRPGPPGGGAG